MPFFRYSVVDSAGQAREGSIQAATSDAARLALVNAGMSVRNIAPQATQTAPVMPKATVAARPAKPVAVKSTPATASTPAPVAAPPSPGIVRTRPASDKERFILFSQLGRFVRAGIAPNQAFDQLAGQSTKPAMAAALHEAARSATAGEAVSDAFARYPDVFPPDVIATYRAGELGGFLAEACDDISNQSHTSHALKRKMLYYGLVLLAVISAFPFSLAVVQGALASMDVQEKAGGSLPPVPTLLASVQKTTIAMAPAAFAGIAGLFALWKLWHSRGLTPARHRLVLMVPILAGRAKAESLARFGWIMSMLARGGAPPNVCLQVAAASMPNLELARRMLATAATMKENERLSSALQRSDLLTPEYRNVVENGELTGDVPGAVMNMARATSAEFEARDKSFAHLSGMLFYIPFGLLILLLAVFLYKTWYGGIMDRFLPE